jgi:hypothetical protein
VHGLTNALLAWLAVLPDGWLPTTAVPTAVSVLYFWSTRHKPLISRVARSIHGFLFVTAWVFISVLGETTVSRSEPSWTPYTFAAIILLGLVSVAYSLWGSSMRWYMHLVQILNVSYGLLISYRGALFFDPG